MNQRNDISPCPHPESEQRVIESEYPAKDYLERWCSLCGTTQLEIRHWFGFRMPVQFCKECGQAKWVTQEGQVLPCRCKLASKLDTARRRDPEDVVMERCEGCS